MRKKISTTISEHQEVNLGAHLEYDGFNRTQLLRALLEGYINDDQHIRKYISEYKKENCPTYKKYQKIDDSKEAGREREYRRTILSQKEIENMYDIFDEDFPD